MFRIVCVALIVLLSACGTVEKTGNRQIAASTSPNGQAFHFMPVHEKGVTDITVRIAWPANWARTTGLNPAVPYIGADLILSGGTESLKPQEVLEQFNDANSRGELSVSPDYVYGELTFPREHIDETVKVASEMLANPQLNDQWMERIKQEFITRQRDVKSQSAHHLWDAARLRILGNTPLLQSLNLSDIDSFKDISRQEIFDWHKQTFTKIPQAVAVTGAISQDDAGLVVDTLLQGLPEGTAFDAAEDSAEFSPATILLHLPEAEKTSIAFIGQLPAAKAGGIHEDVTAVNLLGNANGPLFNAIRTELRATYGLNAGYINLTQHLRLFFMAGEVELEQLAQVRDVTLSAYESFRLDPDLTGLDELQNRLVSDVQKDVRFVDVAARVVTEQLLNGQDPVTTPALPELYAAISEQSMRSRLRDVFPPASSLMVLAVSSNADALPGACVVTSIEQVSGCQ